MHDSILRDYTWLYLVILRVIHMRTWLYVDLRGYTWLYMGVLKVVRVRT